VVDCAEDRHVITLAEKVHGKEMRGRHMCSFKVPRIDLSGLEESELVNVGLLLATLFNGEEEILQISMMVEVERLVDGTLQRTVLNPLEE
jgi:hypothetical protein